MNHLRWDILRRISLLNLREKITMSELATELLVSNSKPAFTDVIKFLEENGAIDDIEDIGSAKLMKFNLRKIDDLFKETKIYQDTKNWMHTKSSFVITS